MKILYSFLLLCSFTYALNITDDTAFQKVYQSKENSDKIVLMIYSAKTCPQCAYMKKKVFKQKSVKAFMDKKIVVIEKDINHDELPKGFEYFGIPTMFFIDNKGEQIGKIIGSSRANIFLEKLQDIVGK